MADYLDRALTILQTRIRDDKLGLVKDAIVAAVVLKAAKGAVELGPSGLYKKALGAVFKGLKQIPGVSDALEAKKQETLKQIEDAILDKTDNDVHATLPDRGFSKEEVIAKAKALRGKEQKFHSNKAFGGIYHEEEEELTELQTSIYTIYSCSNALYPGIFTGVRKFEAEAVSMVVNLLNGDENCCGSLTSGGTESIILAMLAYKMQGLAKGITSPEVICATSAHGALDKACHYFDIKLRKLPFDPVTMKLRVDDVKKNLNKNTICVYTSAPTFCHGVVDPIPELAALCKKRGIGVHVDNCLGGILWSFLQEQNLLKTPFDFTVDGVTSISCDLHKFGYAGKGASVIAYSSKLLRQYQYCIVTDWSGGMYATPTFQGSRNGGIIAQAWATLMYQGQDKYRAAAKKLHKLHQRLLEGVRNTPGLRVVSEPEGAIVSFDAEGYDVYTFASKMEEKGWDLNKMQNPRVCGLCVGERTESIIDSLLADMKECAEYCQAHPDEKPTGTAGVYGSAASVPAEAVDELLRAYLDTLYKVNKV